MITEQIEKDRLRAFFFGGGGLVVGFFRVCLGNEESSGAEGGWERLGDTGGAGLGGAPITPHCSLIPERMIPSGRERAERTGGNLLP